MARLAILTNANPGPEGGIQRFVKELSETAEALDQVIDVIQLNASISDRQPRAVQRWFDGVVLAGNIVHENETEVTSLIRRLSKCDLIIMAGSAPMFLLREHSLRRIVTAQCAPVILSLLFPMQEMEYYLGFARTQAIADIISPIAASSRVTIVPSDYSLIGLRRYFDHEMTIVKVPLAIRAVPITSTQTKDIGSGPYIITVTRLDPLAVHKNVSAVAACWPDVVREVPAAKLVIVGSGAATLPQGSHVLRLGGLGDQDRAQLVANSHGFVLPSAIEAFGLAAAEALSLGAPVVAMRCGAIPELVVHKRTGYLVDAQARPVLVGDHIASHLYPDRKQLTDSLIDLLTNESSRVGMSASAKTSVRHLTWQRLLEAYMRIGITG